METVHQFGLRSLEGGLTSLTFSMWHDARIGLLCTFRTMV